MPRRARSRTPRSEPGPPSALGRNSLLWNQHGIGDVLVGRGVIFFIIIFYFFQGKRLTGQAVAQPAVPQELRLHEPLNFLFFVFDTRQYSSTSYKALSYSTHPHP